MPKKLKGRDIMVVADEDVAKLWPSPPSFTWTYDITQEKLPVPISTFQVPGLDPDGSPQPAMTGCHQPSERFTGTVVPFACGTPLVMRSVISVAALPMSIWLQAMSCLRLSSEMHLVIPVTACLVAV